MESLQLTLSRWTLYRYHEEISGEKGLLIRPLGNTIYLMPPYCVTKGQLASIYEKIADVLE